VKYYAIYSVFNHADGHPDVLFRAVFEAANNSEAYEIARGRIPFIPDFVEDVADVDEAKIELKVMRWCDWEASLTAAWDDFTKHIVEASADE
jgi:hypothetical protein